MSYDLDLPADADRRSFTIPPRAVAFLLAAVAFGMVGIVISQVGHTSSPAQAPPVSLTSQAAGVRVVVPGRTPTDVGMSRSLLPGTPTASAQLEGWNLPAARDLVAVRGLRSRASSNGQQRESSAAVAAASVSLLAGRVRISGAAIEAHGAVVDHTASGTIETASTMRVVVDGRAVQVKPNHAVYLPRIGTLVIGEQALVAVSPTGDDSGGPRWRAVGAIAHLRITSAVAGLPAGSEVIVGQVDVAVREVQSKQARAARTGAAADVDNGTGDAVVPRRATAVRGTGTAATGSLQGYMFPVLGASDFTDTWGAPRATTGTHVGTDIFADQGTPIVAIADGTLDRVGWNSVGGMRFWLYDDFGNAFYHAHLSAFSPLAADGVRVRAGDVIGFVGDTGDAKGTPFHLHFEVHPGDAGPVNPFPFLSAWQQGVSVAIDALTAAIGGPAAPGAGGLPLPVLVPQHSHDISGHSGIGEASLMDRVSASATRPITEEATPVDDGEALDAAFDAPATSARSR